MVPTLVGKEPHLLKWLWAQTAEHRTPIQKAVYLVLLKASGGDFRIGMIANAVALGRLCLAMILMARRRHAAVSWENDYEVDYPV